MHLLYIARSQQSLEELYLLLDALLDPRMYSPFHATTASAPSLRASAAEPYAYAAMAPPAQDDSGNIKVVVRCRTFLKRGTSGTRRAHPGGRANTSQRRTRAPNA